MSSVTRNVLTLGSEAMSVEHKGESLSRQNSMKKYSCLHLTGDDCSFAPSTMNEACFFLPDGNAVVFDSTIP
eukprot:5456143-Amphidinium_carterae.1